MFGIGNPIVDKGRVNIFGNGNAIVERENNVGNGNAVVERENKLGVGMTVLDLSRCWAQRT